MTGVESLITQASLGCTIQDLSYEAEAHRDIMYTQIPALVETIGNVYGTRQGNSSAKNVMKWFKFGLEPCEAYATIGELTPSTMRRLFLQVL